jgi:aspartyl-tRNA(Asn)/glutamyl-tRNA(Gln) amidotransferase subunit A
MVAFASSLDQAGVIARSAADCALLLQVMAGFDPRDSTSVDRRRCPTMRRAGPRLRACASACRANCSAPAPAWRAMRARDAARCAELEAARGATLVDIDLPTLPLSSRPIT